MSYTICIVATTIPHGDEDAWRHLRGLLARSEQERDLPAAPAFIELIDKLTARFPCICELGEDEENALWSDGPLKNNAGHSVAILGMVHHRVGVGLPFVVQTANALGLTVFDEQSGLIHRPVPDLGQTFRVLLCGVHGQFTIDEVAAALVPLFKRPEPELRALLDGRRTVVKRGLGKSEADRYRIALEQRGCACAVEAEAADTVSASYRDQTAVPANASPEEAYIQGKSYAEGKGTAPNMQRAVACYRIAADQGHADAQARLGIAYLQGEGIGRDPAWAFSWLRKAAEQGNAEAQYWLGHVAEKPAPLQAIDWYRKAAEQGHIEAQIRLTVMYSAEGTPYEDQAQATAWYCKVAEQGSAGAQYMVGLRYLLGRGISQDSARARDWFEKAAGQGHAGAKSQLDAVLRALGNHSSTEARKPFWKLW